MSPTSYQTAPPRGNIGNVFNPTKDKFNAWRRPTLAGAKPQLPWALESLTTVFGMGTGVTSPLLPPD